MQPERDFSAWLDHQDADALERVFDAMGGKLLLLAAHLAGPGQLAQDLVQAAFLAAMAHGTSWDRHRPLWPWLATILHNELRMQVRRDRRRREVAIDDLAIRDVAADPAKLAASQEVLGTVLAAIEALPLPYRQVLRLRLVHGLRPVDIARSLEAPVGTVRAQLHRGLEQLRGTLPAGVTAMLGMLLMGEQALLAQVRQQVFETAGVEAAALVPSTGQVIGVGGVLSMNAKTITSVVACLVVLLCIGLAIGVPSWLAPGTTPMVLVAPAAAELPVAAAPSSFQQARDSERQAVDGTEQPAWPLTVTVLSNSGEPVPDAVVQVWTAPNGGAFWNRESQFFLREDVAAGTTTSAGLFCTSLDALREQSDLFFRSNTLWVEASWPHGRSSNELLALPKSREAVEIAVTIQLRRSRGIRGRVVDGVGNAVARATIGTVTRDRLSPSTDRTNGDGNFFVEWHREAKYWPSHLSVVDARLGATTVPVPPFEAASETADLGDLVLTPQHLVHGVVELGDGSAIAGMQVLLQEIDASLGNDQVAIGRWLMTTGRKSDTAELHDGVVVVQNMKTNTGRDGSFQFAGLDPERTYFVSLRILQGKVGAVVHAGDGPVRLRVDGQLVTIEVVDGDGLAVPGVRITTEGYDPDGTSTSHVKRPGFPDTGMVCSNWPVYGDPDGRRVMLSPFGFLWRIGTVDDTVQPAFARHEAFAGVSRATCRLVVQTETRLGKLHIVAVDEQGNPIRFGAFLKALDRDLQHNDRRMVTPLEGWTWDLPAGPWSVRTVLGKEVIYLRTNEGFTRGYQEHVVTIESGRTTELRVVAKPAGLVAFRLRSTQATNMDWPGLRIEAQGREIALSARGREPWILPEQRQRLLFVTSQALPPGVHRFRVQADGYQMTICDVDVVTDQLNTVRVDLIPR